MAARDAETLSEVDRAAMDAALAKVRARVRDPREGVFGTDTVLWRVNRESIVFLGAGRAALLQLAHPWVAHAIDQHSKTRSDPFGRFQRTFLHVFSMTFGDLDAALRAARAVWTIHGRIRGTLPDAAGRWAAGSAYLANDPDALLWVHATLFDTALWCYERVVGRLSGAEKEQYYAETKRFAWLFGIPDDVIPPDWGSFRAYVERTLASDALEVVPVAREMCGFLLQPLVPGTGWLMEQYGELTAWLLPERLAEGFGLERGGEAGRRRTERTLDRIRRVHPWLPARLRFLPAWHEAQHRLAGRPGRDLLGEWMTRAMVGRATISRGR